jgi:hypothetical protein
MLCVVAHPKPFPHSAQNWPYPFNEGHAPPHDGLCPYLQQTSYLPAISYASGAGRRERSGHLFQNRYKSIVCEEDPYLLELIRYIHLNPLRAGLVKDFRELDTYPWSGHAAILGKRKNPLIPDKPNKPDKRDRPSQ